MSIEECDFLIVLSVLAIIIRAIGRVTLVLRVQVINLKLLIVYIEHCLLQLLLNSLIFLISARQIHKRAVLMVEVSQNLRDLGDNPALILLGQAFTGYFEDESSWDLICAPSNPKQTKVSIELMRHLVSFIL